MRPVPEGAPRPIGHLRRRTSTDEAVTGIHDTDRGAAVAGLGQRTRVWAALAHARLHGAANGVPRGLRHRAVLHGHADRGGREPGTAWRAGCPVDVLAGSAGRVRDGRELAQSHGGRGGQRDGWGRRSAGRLADGDRVGPHAGVPRGRESVVQHRAGKEAGRGGERGRVLHPAEREPVQRDGAGMACRVAVRGDRGRAPAGDEADVAVLCERARRDGAGDGPVQPGHPAHAAPALPVDAQPVAPLPVVVAASAPALARAHAPAHRTAALARARALAHALERAARERLQHVHGRARVVLAAKGAVHDRVRGARRCGASARRRAARVLGRLGGLGVHADEDGGGHGGVARAAYRRARALLARHGLRARGGARARAGERADGRSAERGSGGGEGGPDDGYVAVSSFLRCVARRRLMCSCARALVQPSRSSSGQKARRPRRQKTCPLW